LVNISSKTVNLVVE